MARPGTGTGTGTKASNGWRAFDGDPATSPDTLAAESWIDIDAGDAGPVTIDRIRFRPRGTHLSRANGTVFRGSDDDGATWTDLHTISGVSADQWYEVKLAERASHRRIRVYDNHDGRANLSEIEFWYYLPDEACPWSNITWPEGSRRFSRKQRRRCRRHLRTKEQTTT